MTAFKAGTVTRRYLWLVLAMVGIATVGYTLVTTITAPLIQFGFTVAMGLLLLGVVRVRTVLLALTLLLLLWPAVYEFRNEQRIEVGGTLARVEVPEGGAFERIREDKLLAIAGDVGRITIPQPTPLTLARFGLIPRFLDQNRGELPSGKLLNAALGGTDRSSNTFTLLGGIWSLSGGWWGLTIYVACVSAFITMVCRRLTSIRVAIAMLAISTLLWIEATYPDNVAGLLQNLVSLGVLVFVLKVLPAGVKRLNSQVADSSGSNRRRSPN
jgi:hypothetical protein